MTFQINTTKSKSGKRTLYFVSLNNKRLTKTNFSKKWEAEREFKNLLSHFGEEKLIEFSNK